MGKYSQGIFGPYSGRVGNIIGTFWKGKAVLRIRAASYADANTIPQQTQRMKFKLVSSFLKANEKLIRLGFAAANPAITAFNSALKANLSDAITGLFPSLALDLTKVKLSFGNLLGLESPVTGSTQAGIVELDWDDNSNSSDAFVGDKLMVSIIDDLSGEVMMFGNDITRTEGSASMQLPATWSGRSVHLHAFFVKDVDRVTSQDHVSTSQYLGTVVVA